MKSEQRVTKAMRDCQLVLSKYLEPGTHDPLSTLNDLLDILDRTDVIHALTELEAHEMQSPSTVPKLAVLKVLI